MAKIKKINKAVFALPSLVTLSSVFCAFLSMAWSFEAQSQAGQERLDTMMFAALAVIGSIVFDTFDGKVARATHTSTKFGMELDSLADAVSFGIAPAILIYGFCLTSAGWYGIIAAFLFACGAILRLARFNVEAPPEGVQTYFKGIPAPGGAACIAAIVMATLKNPQIIDVTNLTSFEVNTFGAIAIAIGILMVSTVKYKTFKGKKTTGDYIFIAIGVLLFAALCFVLHPATAFFFFVCYYVGFGILNSIYMSLKHMKPHRRKRRRASMTDLPAVTPSGELQVETDNNGTPQIKSDMTPVPQSSPEIKDENGKSEEIKDENGKSEENKDENGKSEENKDENGKSED